MPLKNLLAITTSLLLFTSPTLAKTDLDGCTSFTSMVTVRPEPGYGNTYASVVWYVPDTLEICKGVDCGGGRAPPKSVPGCPLYDGPETVTAEFLKEDPMKPTQAVTSEEVEETGSADGAEESSFIATTVVTTTEPAEAEETGTTEGEGNGDGEESSSVRTTVVTTTKPVETAATATDVSQNGAEESSSSSSTGADEGEATTTGPESADETGAAARVAANLFVGAAAAVFALL